MLRKSIGSIYTDSGRAAAQPCLDGRPPCATALAGKHHPPPRLDDVAEWPQIPGLPGDVQRLVQLLLEPGAVGFGQRPTDQVDRLREGGPLARSATLTTPPRGPGQGPLTGVTQAPINEGRLPPREEQVCLSGSRLETHQHCTPAGASRCHSLLLDPVATMGNDLHKRLFLLVTGRGE